MKTTQIKVVIQERKVYGSHRLVSANHFPNMNLFSKEGSIEHYHYLKIPS